MTRPPAIRSDRKICACMHGGNSALTILSFVRCNCRTDGSRACHLRRRSFASRRNASACHTLQMQHTQAPGQLAQGGRLCCRRDQGGNSLGASDLGVELHPAELDCGPLTDSMRVSHCSDSANMLHAGNLSYTPTQGMLLMCCRRTAMRASAGGS